VNGDELSSMKRIILAHSGGVDSSAAIAWLGAQFHAEVIAVVVDLGRRSDLVDVRERGLSRGAIRCHVVDAREELARRYLLPALQAGAFGGGRSPVTPTLGLPIVARKVVDLARMEGADTIAFGPGRGHDGASLDVLLRALDADVELVAVPRIGTNDDVGEASTIVANVWGRAVGFDQKLPVPFEVPEDTYLLTRAPHDSPDQPASVELEFDEGVPVRVNGIEMNLLEMIESLEIIGGTHGVGRTDTVVTRPDGATYREIGEAPAAVMLHVSHKTLEARVIPPALIQLASDVGRAYADVIRDGQWFSGTRAALDGFTAALQPKISGSVRLSLLRGECRVVGSKRAADDNNRPSATDGAFVRRTAAPGSAN
jgi:argininosuccinate synthase